MATATVFRGKAAVEGVVGAFDAVLYAIKQTVKASQAFELEEIKDEHGYDIGWLARNEHALFDCSLKLVADTVAHSIIPATAVASTAAVSTIGQPFLAPLSTITLSGFSLTAMNGVFQVLSGFDVDLGNTKVGDLNIKLRKYASTDQQTAIAAIPS